MELNKGFFDRPSDVVAKELLGKILVSRKGRKLLKARIVEVEAYFDEKDPASWAKMGKRKDNFAMWMGPGTILIKNVHKYLMLNLVTGKEGKAGAVLIRALEPVNFEGRCSGPGLLTQSMGITKELNGKNIFEISGLFLEGKNSDLVVGNSGRVGVRNDLKEQHRFYIRENEYVSRRNFGKKKNGQK